MTEDRRVYADELLAWSQHIEDGGRLSFEEFQAKLDSTFTITEEEIVYAA